MEAEAPSLLVSRRARGTGTPWDWNIVFAKLRGGLAFAGYHFYAGLDRRLDTGTLRRLVMSRGTDDEAHSELRSPISHGNTAK